LITGLEDEKAATMAFPIPADDRLTVSVPGYFRAELTDSQGKRVFEGPGEDHLVINTSAMPAGLYLLNVGIRKEKVIVRH
jgi:hypothetical protein